MAEVRDRDRAILDAVFDGICIVDRERRITFWNKGAERITGFAAGGVIGRDSSDDFLRHVSADGVTLRPAECPLAELLTGGQAREAGLFVHHADGHRIPVVVRVAPLLDDRGTIAGGVEIFSDNAALVAARHRMAEPVEAYALDPLTAVATREAVESGIGTVLAASHPRNPEVGILLADVDRFAHINARHGRQSADNVLKLVAQTIRRSVRGSDLVGRWGADEFVVAVFGVDRTRVIMIANKLRAAVERAPVVLGRGEGHVTVSIGATVARAGDTADTALQRAERLLYESKASGRDEVKFGE
jgi:diguanylate cyclase (GGDEF)-like protein/PAS domain S-box-containing protein